MATGGYIPSIESDLRDFGNNFDSLIGADPARYGLVQGDADTIHSYVSAFNAAFLLANDPATHSTVTVVAKDSAKAAMLGTIRPYAQRIAANNGVSNDDKAALRVTIRKTSRTPVPPPTTRPVLTVARGVGEEHIIRFQDSDYPINRAKPENVISMQLFVVIAAAPATDPAQAKYLDNVNRQKFVVSFNSSDNGKIATYFARWMTLRSDVSSWSAPVSLSIAF